MNKITQEIATILQSQIDQENYEIQYAGLSSEQTEEIIKFGKGFSRNGAFFPFPLKTR